MTSTRISARDKLLTAAAGLFYDDGIAATGIDTIIKKAKVAKMSLYNNFSSKAELVQAYIDERHWEWLGLYEERVKDANSPEERILAVFDAYMDHASFEYKRGFRGCGILNAAAELPAQSEGRLCVKEHKDEVENILLKHLRESPSISSKTARETAEHLSFLLEGAMARAGLEGKSEKLEKAKEIAQLILKNL